ncbi:MAG: hypothetical protein IKH88_07090 [Prevotella sp.]|nr:hypothetical protein [Prevotella sp.]
MKKNIYFCLFTVVVTTMSVGCIKPNPKTDQNTPKADTIIVHDTVYITVHDTVRITETPPPTPVPEKVENLMPTKMEFYREMLEYFCNRFYKEVLDAKYIKGSILIEKVEVLDKNKEVRVKARHNYDEGVFSSEKERQPFKATVLKTDENEYEITFERTEDGANFIKTIQYP